MHKCVICGCCVWTVFVALLHMFIGIGCGAAAWLPGHALAVCVTSEWAVLKSVAKVIFGVLLRRANMHVD